MILKEYWILEWYGWYLWKHWWIQSKYKALNIDCIDYIIVDMLSNKKVNLIVTDLFIRGRKQNISLVFITQSYLCVLKNIRLKSAHGLIKKISNEREVQWIAISHSSDIEFYKKFTPKPYSFLVSDTTLASDNPLRFRRNILERI